jgi:hypothetical protein
VVLKAHAVSPRAGKASSQAWHVHDAAWAVDGCVRLCVGVGLCRYVSVGLERVGGGACCYPCAGVPQAQGGTRAFVVPCMLEEV